MTLFFSPFSRFFSVGEAGGGCFSQHPIKGGQTEFISFRWDEETSVCRRTRRDEGGSSEPVWSGPVPTSRFAIIYFLRSPSGCADATARQDGVAGSRPSGARTFGTFARSGAPRKVGKHRQPFAFY